MEVNSFSSDIVAFGKIVMNSVLEIVAAETLLAAQRSVASLLIMISFSLVLSVKMVPKYAMSLLLFFIITCGTIIVRAELTKVPSRPFLRGNPGLLPGPVSSRDGISAVKRVAGCNPQTGCLLKDGAPLAAAPFSELLSAAPLSELVSPDKRFPFGFLDQKNDACPENEDGSDTEDDDEDDDGDAEDQDDEDDANDEDFSGEEGGDDDEEGDHEADPEANGNEGSDDDDEGDEDGDEEGDDDDDDDDEEEDDEDDEEEDQPPAKKRK